MLTSAILGIVIGTWRKAAGPESLNNNWGFVPCLFLAQSQAGNDR